MGIALEVEEAHFRDLGDPLLRYLRRLTADPGTQSWSSCPSSIFSGRSGCCTTSARSTSSGCSSSSRA